MAERFLKSHHHQRGVVNPRVFVVEHVLPRHLDIIKDRYRIDLFEAARDRIVVLGAIGVEGVATHPVQSRRVDRNGEAQRVLALVLATDDRQHHRQVLIRERCQRSQHPRSTHDDAVRLSLHDAGIEKRLLLAERRLAIDLRGDEGMRQADIVAATVVKNLYRMLAERWVILPPVMLRRCDPGDRSVHVVGSASELSARVLGPRSERCAAISQVLLGAGNLEREV